MEISAFYWIVNEYNCLEQNVDLAKNVLFYWEMRTEDLLLLLLIDDSEA